MRRRYGMRKIKCLMIGWGEGATIYRAKGDIRIEDYSIENTLGDLLTVFHIYEKDVLIRTIIGLPVEIEYASEKPVQISDKKEATDE
jgi:hypothetical protein